MQSLMLRFLCVKLPFPFLRCCGSDGGGSISAMRALDKKKLLLFSSCLAALRDEDEKYLDQRMIIFATWPSPFAGKSGR